MDSGVKWGITGGIFVVVLIVGLVFGSSFFQTIEAGHRGVGHTFGSVDEDVYGEGFHFKAPWRTIVEINVQEQVVDHPAMAASKDLQTVTTSVAVTYHADPTRVWWIYQNLGETHESWQHKKLNPIIAESVKSITARYTAADLIQRRDDVKRAIQEVIQDRCSEEAGINVSSVNITNFEFSATFNDSIEAKVKAEQDALRAQNELERERVEQEKRIVQAEAEKKERVLNAEGRAMAITLEATAQAEANRTLSESIDNKILDFKKLERWDGKLPKVTGGSDSMILINPETE